ncbi:MAG TPA: cache domain-containing protein, partial [Paraburkholderia sp.]|nr:cache domain-containing protein [Paraburkholderia sp.]
MTLNKKLASMIAVLWIGLILIGAFGAWQNRASMIADRRDQLTSLVQQGMGIVNRYYTLSQQHTMSEDDAKKQALAEIAVMRYGKDGYMSVNDSRPVMLMHPFKPEMVGKPMSGFTDPSGNHLFVDIVNAGNQPDGGFVNYLWAKPGSGSDEPVAKTSFAMHFAPWDWYLVTGMYMDDVQSAFYASLLRWLLITVVLGAVATAVMVLVLRSVRQALGGDLEIALDAAQRMAHGDLATPVPVSHTDRR